MTEISKSEKINTFLKESFIKRAEEAGQQPASEYIEMWDDWDSLLNEKENDPKWKENNLEHDLRSTNWILEKVRASEGYAQNLYAAMCNMRFCKLSKDNTFNILKDELWSCSWRSSGGIIANMRQEGDYIDWYCSGMGEKTEGDMSVSEGIITDEIKEDLLKLGWMPVPWPEDNLI